MINDLCRLAKNIAKPLFGLACLVAGASACLSSPDTNYNYAKVPLDDARRNLVMRAKYSEGVSDESYAEFEDAINACDLNRTNEPGIYIPDWNADGKVLDYKAEYRCGSLGGK